MQVGQGFPGRGQLRSHVPDHLPSGEAGDATVRRVLALLWGGNVSRVCAGGLN